MRILVTGPQGSGKTTQAENIAQKLDLCMIDSGDLVRDHYSDGTPEGEKIKLSLDNGQLVDNKIVADLVTQEINRQQADKKGFVMDGYPRTLPQLKEFDPEFDKVFYLEVPEEIVVKRLLQRKRVDDTPELIKERLRIYHQLTEPVLDFYKEQDKLIKIDGSKTISEVEAEINQYL